MLNFSKIMFWKRNRATVTEEADSVIPVVVPATDYDWKKLDLPDDQALTEVRDRAVAIVPQRASEAEEAFSQTGALYSDFHQQVVGSSPLPVLRSKLEDAMTHGQQRIAQQYKDDADAAARDFKDDCLPHLAEVEEGKLSREAQVEDLRKEVDELLRQRSDCAMRLTGDPAIEVPKVNRFWLLAVSLLAGSVITVIDAFLGAPSFSFGSNDILAYTMSFAFGFALGFVIYFWALAAKRIISFRDATQALADYKRRHSRDLHIQSVELIRVSDNEYHTVRNMRSLFMAIIATLAVARIFTSRESMTMLVVGMTATFMILIVSLVGYYIERSMAPPYGDHHKKLDALDAKIEAGEEQIEQLTNPSPEEAEPEWLATAKKRYLSQMDEAWAKVDREITTVMGAAANYREMVSQLRLYGDTLRKDHQETCKSVLHRIYELKADRGEIDQDTDVRFDEELAASCLALPAFNDGFTLTIESRAFNPEDLRPARIPAEPNRILQDLVASVPEAPKPRRPRIRIITRITKK